MHLPRQLVLAALMVTTLAGCATPPPKTDIAATQAFRDENDPLQPMNRDLYGFNDRLDAYVAKPITHTYVNITNQWFRSHASNFTSNIGTLREAIYFMASGKPRDAGTALVRFVVNSTVGIGGIFDPATGLGYHKIDTDLGLVLAGYGVGEGPYLFIPVTGPTTLRDGTASIASLFVTPIPYGPTGTAGTIFRYSVTALGGVNTRAKLDPTIDDIKATSLDPYAAFRSLYRQSRASQLARIDACDTPTVPDWFPQQKQEQNQSCSQ